MKRLASLLLALSPYLNQGYVLTTYPLSPLSLYHPSITPLSPSIYYNLRSLPIQQTILPYIPTVQTIPQVARTIIQDIESDGVLSSFEKGSKFKARRNKTVAPLTPKVSYMGRRAARDLDLCYFLGSDIFKSHVRCNNNWADGTAEGVRRYINELTFETNQMLGLNNFKISWKGPYEYQFFDPKNPRYPKLSKPPQRDVLTTVQYDSFGNAKTSSCDAVVFLVFNEFAEDCETETYGHEFGGYSFGGMCDQKDGSGYAVVVDQGYLDDSWTGPQILAHHLLVLLTSDLEESKHCKGYRGDKESLLYPQLYPGKQRVDSCVVSKLRRSGISNRDCMRYNNYDF